MAAGAKNVFVWIVPILSRYRPDLPICRYVSYFVFFSFFPNFPFPFPFVPDFVPVFPDFPLDFLSGRGGGSLPPLTLPGFATG